MVKLTMHAAKQRRNTCNNIKTTNYKMNKTKENYLAEHLRSIQDFPKKGINFRDVTTLFKDAKCLEIMEEELYKMYKDKGITKVVALESRGYIMGAILARKLNAGFVMVASLANCPQRPSARNMKRNMAQTGLRCMRMPFVLMMSC